jgi:hypothetical protein
MRFGPQKRWPLMWDLLLTTAKVVAVVFGAWLGYTNR